MPDGDVSYDGAIDEFLSEGGEETVEDEAPESKPKKEQPAKKPQAKTPGKQPKQEEPAGDSEDDDESSEDAKPKDGPWKSELAKRGIDSPEVNQYMQEVVQPYITRLEQQGGPIAALFEGNEEAASIAAGILEGLDTNPADTIANMIHLLDVSDEDINNALMQLVGDEGDETPETNLNQQPDEEDLTPEQQWVRQRMQEQEQQSEREAYDAFLETVAAEFGEGFDADLFNLAVSATGDFEGAMELYPALVEKYAKAAPKPAPPVMGASRPGTQRQPTERQYDGSNAGWEAAFDDFFAEAFPKKR